ncbi:MAG: Spermine synthase [Marmoricola sp.]|nr:Spermine synthase [Marmoricola sp.]
MTSRRPRFLLEVVVFAVGMASLGAEIAAARLLAPWFGASTIVWANTIATVLVALSIGYAVGGRLADRTPTMAGLSRWVLGAAALLALVPFVSGPFLRESTTAFAELSGGLFVGSLLGVGVLIAVPVLMLGIVSPYAVRLKIDQVSDAGRVAGRLYAVGTLGSLAGTFLASLLLIPVVGTHRTFLLLALVLVLAALPGLGRRWLAVGAAVLVGVLVLIALPVGSTKTVTSGGRVIWERETEYQYARVIQRDDGQRLLELNEGQAVHSVYRPGQWLTGGYWDEMLALPFAADHPPRRIAILGSAAGTTARALAHFFPGVRIDAVEIDPDVTEVGRRLFDLRGARVHTHAADARPWLQRQTGTYDAILVDAYRQPYIPFYLATREFFDVVRQRLAPGGVVAINVGHPPQSAKLEQVLTATLGSVLGRDRVHRDPVDETNTMLLGTTAGADPAAALRGAQAPAEVRPVLDATADRLARGLTGGTVYTDDRAPVEWLVDASLAQVAR